MAETIPGGAYLQPDGKTWHDANDEVLDSDAKADAKSMNAERQQQRDEAEAQRQLAEAQQNPIANALANLLGRSGAGRVEQPARASERPSMQPSSKRARSDEVDDPIDGAYKLADDTWVDRNGKPLSTSDAERAAKAQQK
jgi:hypothetical protein